MQLLMIFVFFGMPFSPYGNKVYNAWQYPDEELGVMVEKLNEKFLEVEMDIIMIHAEPWMEGLEEFVGRKKPKFVLSGHHHYKYGVEFKGETVFINCASVNSLYMVTHPPVVFDYIF